ncbi:cysteine--tRNA ligase, mitochondrial [Plakobranchus ocellatus]|uniref:cysteine--tRNA ligase n=1 Tax=Plakobranchus ocellatus TaxID=259542 RepID=A0AAV4ATB2_9GAST|nr:cysteine--tRNA ligase, mitochondrial [Plakobranchus ocellatus]
MKDTITKARRSLKKRVRVCAETEAASSSISMVETETEMVEREMEVEEEGYDTVVSADFSIGAYVKINANNYFIPAVVVSTEPLAVRHFLVRNDQILVTFSRLQYVWLKCKKSRQGGHFGYKYVHSCSNHQNLANNSTNGSNSEAGKWSQPEGYSTGIMIYHPLVKKKVPLVLQQEKIVTWYACGPTVYDSPHLGHASSYVRLDIIRRILARVFNIDTILVMGVTDVDDKIIQKSYESGQPIEKITKLYESEFFADMAKLNVAAPNIITRVCDYIPQIISFVQRIEEKGLAYRTSDGSVYFDVKKYGKYGRFAMQKDIPGADEGLNNVKKNSQDFALWKGSKAGEPWWPSPWGKGRPGWHVECSAMASDIFGSNFDIHSGGEDLMFPHHENELAQSCAFHGNDQWANYWLHTGHLYIAGQADKMSKSLKNVISISDFLDTYTPNHFRMLCLLNNYKKRIEFSEERMQKAVSVTNAIHGMIQRCDSYVQGQQIDCVDVSEAELYKKLHLTRRTVEAAFANDFNTPQALASVMRLIKYTNQVLVDTRDVDKSVNVRSCAPVAAVSIYLKRLMEQLGTDTGRRIVKDNFETDLQFHKTVEAVVGARTKIREFAKNKQHLVHSAGEAGISEEAAIKLMKTLYRPLWEVSDSIRHDVLNAANVQINDGTDGSTWSVVHSKKARREES